MRCARTTGSAIGAIVVIVAATLLAACGGDDSSGTQASIGEPVTTPAARSPHELSTAAPSGGPATTIATAPTSDVAPATTIAPGTLPHLPGTTTPATTVPGQTAPPSPAPPTTRVLSAADEAEPTCVAVLAASVTGAAAPGAELSRLEPMLGQLVAYAQMHADVFGGYGLVWHGPDDGSTFIGITHDVASHREALEAGVDDPDDLVVCRSPLNEADRSALIQVLQPELQARGAGWGGGAGGAVDVQLRADQELYAAELHARYGEMLQLTVGAFPYPMPDPLPEPTCEDLPEGGSIPGLEIAVDAPTGPLVMRSDGKPELNVRFRNTGAAAASVAFGQPSALLLAPGTTRVVGGFAGFRADVLDSISLEPGEVATRPVLAGATTCDPADGYRLPAGAYDLVVIVDRAGIAGPPLVTPRLTIELAAP